MLYIIALQKSIPTKTLNSEGFQPKLTFYGQRVLIKRDHPSLVD